MSLDKLISTVAEALAPSITDTPAAPATWIDREKAKGRSAAIKAGTREELVGTLTALGVGTADKLSASDSKVAVKEIDAALSKANVEIQDRIRLKNAMARFGVLKA